MNRCMPKSDAQAQRERHQLRLCFAARPLSPRFLSVGGSRLLRAWGCFSFRLRVFSLWHTWTFFIHLSLGKIYDLFNVRKFCFSWHFIALRIWNISIPDNKYYVIIVFIWIGYFLLFFSKPLSQLIILKNLLILNCAIQLFRNHV